jgi:hypothetical protein
LAASPQPETAKKKTGAVCIIPRGRPGGVGGKPQRCGGLTGRRRV